MSISSCPECAQPVLIPTGADPSAVVRCPHCHAEYLLEAALAKLPPALVLVGHETSPLIAPLTEHEELHLFAQPDADSNPVELFAEPAEDDALSAEVVETAIVFSEPTEALEEPAEAEAFGHFEDEPATELSLDELAGGSGEAFNLEEPHVRSRQSETLDNVQLDHVDDDSFEFDAPASDFEGGSLFAPEGETDNVELEDHVELEAADESLSFGEPVEDEPSLESVPRGDAAAAPALKTSPRKERRKPSMLAGIIIWGTSLPVAAALAFAILFYGFGRDPVGLAPKLPSFLVPASMRTAKVALVPPVMPPGQGAMPARPSGDDELPGFKSDFAPVTPREKPAMDAADPADDAMGAADSADDAAAATTPAEDEMADDTAPADDASAATDASAGDDAMAADATDEPADDATSGADEMAAEETAADDVADDADEPAPPKTRPAQPAVASESADTADEFASEAPAEGDDAMVAETATETDEFGDEPAAEETVVAVVVGPRDNMRYSLDDLDTAVADVSDAQQAIASADKDEVKKLKSQYYRKLYHLAEVATFADRDASDPRTKTDATAVQKLLSVAQGEKGRFVEIGKAAGKWLTISKGKEHQGIVLSGTVQAVTKQGQVFETRVLLTDGAQTVSILSPKAPSVNQDDAVVVAGSIVSDPAKAIAGYDGAEETAVWLGTMLPVGGAL